MADGALTSGDNDSGVVLGGIASWEEQSQPSHLPTAIKGKGALAR